MKKIIQILAAMLTFAACTKEGDVIYQTDPADAPSTTPLVTVIYDPNSVGDGNYNDLIYQSVEQAAKEHDLRTMHLSPSSRTEGLAYLETLFEQMSTAQDTVRRLFIVAAASYDDYLRRNNDRLATNPYTDLLYLETSEPLDGKGNAFGAGFSATAPTVEVMPKAGFTTEPKYDGNSGFYIQGVYPSAVTYTWHQVNSVSTNNEFDEKNKYIYTTVDMTTLGTVTGTATLTIGGNSVIGTEGDPATGNVYGGGDESAVSNAGTPANATYSTTASTIVTLKGNTEVKGNVFGGGNRGLVSGSTTVNIQE